MYDRLKLSIPLLDGVSVVGGCLDEAKEQTNLNTGEVCIFGGLGGLKVSVYPNGLYVTGSLAKFLYPGNIYPLDRHSTAEAVEKLSDALHTDVRAARVTSLEFGTHFIMKHPVGAYLSRLGDMPRLMRFPTGADTLYYRAKGKHPAKKLCFYDKVAEAKVKGETVPGVFDGANVLRYEMRLDRRLPQQLGEPAAQASTLHDRDFYRMLVRKWQDYYFSISKNQLKTSSMSEIETVTDAFEVFFARLMAQSEPNQIADFIEDLKRAGVFKDRKNYSRLKRKLMEVAAKGGSAMPDECIRELDGEVKQAGAYV